MTLERSSITTANDVMSKLFQMEHLNALQGRWTVSDALRPDDYTFHTVVNGVREQDASAATSFINEIIPEREKVKCHYEMLETERGQEYRFFLRRQPYKGIGPAGPTDVTSGRTVLATMTHVRG